MFDGTTPRETSSLMAASSIRLIRYLNPLDSRLISATVARNAMNSSDRTRIRTPVLSSKKRLVANPFAFSSQKNLPRLRSHIMHTTLVTSLCIFADIFTSLPSDAATIQIE